jgi:3-dehydroquinate synthase
MTDGMTRWQVCCHRTIEYEVVKCRRLFDPYNDTLLSVGAWENARRFVVVDSNLEKPYAGEIRDYFKFHDIDAKILIFPAGEPNKTVERYLWILGELDAFPIHRRDEPIIAVGGGVLTDVVGFAANSYRRGVPHINVPTTLMAYIDAAVGIKTGVNFNNSKNRLGAFAPPQKVFLDRSFLKTLPKRHILNGMGEILKLAIIKDLTLFDLLDACGAGSVEAQFQDDAGETILDRSVEDMLDELKANLYEDNLARKMDFGHTFCYGLETCAVADLLHGEAVLLDIVLSSALAWARGMLSGTELKRIFSLVAGLGMVPCVHLADPGVLWKSLEERTCHRNGLQRVPLPAGLGNCTFVNDITLAEIQAACDLVQKLTPIHDPIRQF